jgi:hypothetical protein
VQLHAWHEYGGKCFLGLRGSVWVNSGEGAV